MDIDLHVKLLLMLSIFCLQGLYGRGSGLFRTPALGVESDIAGHDRYFFHPKERRSTVFNVKKFGAIADGQTDDTHV